MRPYANGLLVLGWGREWFSRIPLTTRGLARPSTGAAPSDPEQKDLLRNFFSKARISLLIANRNSGTEHWRSAAFFLKILAGRCMASTTHDPSEMGITGCVLVKNPLHIIVVIQIGEAILD
jgi:hypothetical protein